MTGARQGQPASRSHARVYLLTGGRTRCDLLRTSASAGLFAIVNRPIRVWTATEVTCRLLAELQEPRMSEARVQLQERLCSALLCSLDHSGIDRGAVTPSTTTTNTRDTGSRGDAHAADALEGGGRAAADVRSVAEGWEEEMIGRGLRGGGEGGGGGRVS